MKWKRVFFIALILLAVGVAAYWQLCYHVLSDDPIMGLHFDRRIDMERVGEVGRTGDLVLFVSSAFCLSTGRFRRFFMGFDWSHTAILYIDPLTRACMVWDGKDHGDKGGCHLIKLSDKMRDYDGFCCLVRMRPSVAEWVGSEQELERRFQAVFSSCRDIPFNKRARWVFYQILAQRFSRSGLSPHQLAWLRGSICREPGVICTELTLYTYYVLGILPVNAPSMSACLPQDFIREGRVGQLGIECIYLLDEKNKNKVHSSYHRSPLPL